MRGPESAPAFQQPEVVEKRPKKERFDVIGTHIRGVLIRIEPGTDIKPDTLKKVAETLYPLARDHAFRHFEIKGLASQQEDSDKGIKDLAKTNEGLRGAQSEEDNFVVSVIPSDSVTWNHPLLQESMGGVAYSSVVHQDMVVSISVPLGFQTEKGPIEDALLRQVLTQALIDLGLKEDDLQKIMDMNIVQRVDEKTLEKMIEDRKVTLLEGTKQIARTWAVRVAPLRKSPD